MEGVLVDTDVFSYLTKEKHPLADVYRQHIKNKTVALSFVTVGELLTWGKKRNWSAKKIANLEQRLRACVIVPFDYELCKVYAQLGTLKTSEGTDRTIAANDRWIAACALRHQIPLVSNNRKHFEEIPGLVLISEAPLLRAPAPQGLPLPPPSNP